MWTNKKCRFSLGVVGVHPLKHISYEAKLGVVEIQLLIARKTTKRCWNLCSLRSNKFLKSTSSVTLYYAIRAPCTRARLGTSWSAGSLSNLLASPLPSPARWWKYVWTRLGWIRLNRLINCFWKVCTKHPAWGGCSGGGGNSGDKLVMVDNSGPVAVDHTMHFSNTGHQHLINSYNCTIRISEKASV